ncbi:DUF6438 domain-containing protein [Novosphingobium mangrovi (ex Huang et al. 2023)]|uniref:DUF6438 domain-containing protein n=1 Tax=Novosphingobium mangrovi (ex Huang et al. 2023) TaxID=2976432 RepID=A0ABT2I0X3_9SPHN|nr:DUF6438 domain-containing protein [Novosphingobium mangrovi (ex Huang et al. 2023)]MCT2398453.1 DUF6438 domain-containing protein [Novosphingobium mangrovi (ex Huang et al. 2023)]
MVKILVLIAAGCVVLGIGLLGACTLPLREGGPARPREEIVIARGPCNGFCPVYRVSVTPGGLVDFEGLRHTALIGSRMRAVSRRTYDEVRKAVLPLRPPTGTTRDWPCANPPTETSQVTVEWRSKSGTQTTLRLRAGCREADSEMIERLLDRQIKVLGVEAWVRQALRDGVPKG